MHDHLHPDEKAIHLALSRARPAADAACPDLIGLAAFVDGTIGDDRDVVEAHLALCPDCRRAVLHARQVIDDEALPEVPAALIDAARRLVVLPEIATGERRASPGVVWPTLVRWGLAAAATFAICALGHRIGGDLVRAREVSQSGDLYSLGVLTSISQSSYDDAITLAVFPSTMTEEVSR